VKIEVLASVISGLAGHERPAETGGEAEWNLHNFARSDLWPVKPIPARFCRLEGYEMGVYQELGIRRIINCFDTYTLLGGHILSKEVREARDEADRSWAWIWDIQRRTGEKIAELLGAEAAFVPVGVYAGISQCVAALMAGADPEKMRRLPNTEGMRNEVIVQKCLRDFQYDRSITVTGAKIVEVGSEKRGCTPTEMEEAITERTVAIHFMAHGPTGSYASKGCRWLSAEEVIGIGKKHGVPVLVDAAFQCYPLEGFKKYTALGADAALYSCKYFGGPNTAGILVGKKYLIELVALHSFIGQEGASRGKEFLSVAERGAYSSLFRGYKQDRASIVGAFAALKWYMELMRDPERNVLAPAKERAKYFIRAFNDIPDIELGIIDASVEGVDPLKVAVKVTLKKRTPEEVKKMRDELMNGDPEIWVEAEENSLIINITSFRGLMMFDEEDKKVVAEEIRRILKA
jgi:seryl-tRNA(Sec) selenium transferase